MPRVKNLKYNWPLLVKDMQDTVFMSQTAIADRLKVSQQSISNWMTGSRNPGPSLVPDLLKMASEGGLDISKYETNTAIDGISDYLKKNKGRELIRIYDLYSQMSQSDSKRFLRYAEGMK